MRRRTRRCFGALDVEKHQPTLPTLSVKTGEVFMVTYKSVQGLTVARESV